MDGNISNEIVLFFQNLYDGISTASYKDYSKCIFIEQCDSEFKFNQLRKMCLEDIDKWLQYGSQPSYYLYDILFYGLVLNELYRPYCFILYAYKLSGYLLSQVITRTSAAVFFDDNYLYANCKNFSIHAEGQEGSNNFFLDPAQAEDLNASFTELFKIAGIHVREQAIVDEIFEMARRSSTGLIVLKSIWQTY